MRQQVNENSEWKSYNGKRTKFKDLEDGHLLNIIKFIKERNKLLNFDNREDDVLIYLENTAKQKGLVKLEKEIPHRAKDGNGWVVWNNDYKKGCETPVVGFRKLDVEICKKCRKLEFNDFWSEEDERFYKQGLVICHKECKKLTKENKVPENCNFILEQTVMRQNKKED